MDLPAFQQHMKSIVSDWLSSRLQYSDDLKLLCDELMVASNLRNRKQRKTEFQRLLNRANVFHIAMVMLRHLSPQFPVIDDLIATLVDLLKAAIRSSQIDSAWQAVNDRIRVHWTAGLFVDSWYSENQTVDGKVHRERVRHRRMRDATWCDWSLAEMTNSQIRDRWNREHPDQSINISTRDNGITTVRNAILREKLRRGLITPKNTGDE